MTSPAISLIGIIIIFMIGYIIIKFPNKNTEKEQSKNIDFSQMAQHELFDYADQKEDSRTDTKLNYWQWTNICLTIIAIYFLVQIIKEITFLLLLNKAGIEISELIKMMLSQ